VVGGTLRRLSDVDYRSECLFCGKAENEIKYLIRGPGVSICEECVSLCVSVLADEGVELPPPYPDPA
jgi:ATP-dependent Clp protease ATP-binding subunit ClpX